MEVDDRDDQPAPGEMKMKQTEEEMEGTPIAGLIMGGLERSYLVHGDSTFDVLRNVEGGVEGAGVTPFSFTPHKGAGGKKGGSSSTPAFTPTKVVLAGSERFMNMLAAEDPTKLYHGDVEYQKIVSEFRFDKDTVNIPQVRVNAFQGGMFQGRGGRGLTNGRLSAGHPAPASTSFAQPAGMYWVVAWFVQPCSSWAG
jgi:hypothetical protein